MYFVMCIQRVDNQSFVFSPGKCEVLKQGLKTTAVGVHEMTCIAVGDSTYQEGKVMIPFTGFSMIWKTFLFMKMFRD